MPREIVLLTNPASGRGRGPRTAAIVLPRLQEAGFSVRSLTGADAEESRRIARRSVEEGVEALVVVGGDGLVHLAVQALAGSGTRLGIVAAGSGNDLARTLGLPRDPQAAADVVVASRTRTIDLGRTGATWFATVLAAGFDARVNERADGLRWATGPARYAVATLAELRGLRPLPYTLELDGAERRVEAVLVAVGNGPSYGGGLRIAHGAELDDGLLDVVVVGATGRADLLRTFPRLRTGGHTRHPRYERHRVRSVTVAAPGTTAWADGERVGALPLTVDVAPRALEVLVP